MNTINIIAPYKYQGIWVFDDERVGLDKEAFVSGADVMIDRAVAEIRDPENGFVLLFSADEFPGYTLKLVWQRPGVGGGNWYRSEALDLEGWLCPALFRYFDTAPACLYVQVKDRETTWPAP